MEKTLGFRVTASRKQSAHSCGSNERERLSVLPSLMPSRGMRFTRLLGMAIPLSHPVLLVVLLVLLQDASRSAEEEPEDLEEPTSFLWARGNCNADNAVDLSDAIAALNYLFNKTAGPLCLRLCDGDDSKVLDLGDAVALLQLIFHDDPLGAATPPRPCPGSASECDLLESEPCPGDPGENWEPPPWDPDDSGLKLLWDPVTADSGGNPVGVAGYRVHMGWASGRYDQVIDVGLSTELRLEHLVPGIALFLCVTAYDALLTESPCSEELVVSGEES